MLNFSIKLFLAVAKLGHLYCDAFGIEKARYEIVVIAEMVSLKNLSLAFSGILKYYY